ncbi:MAG: DUF438 domain-containing protein [Paludibacteraceae bacterium]|nr:DUF438 domain-containing protein [Paludibacteraceae bacterium]
MKKSIDFSRSVYELVAEYPELADIMDELGFSEVKKPAVLHSVGKLMTIPKGAKMKGIEMLDVVAALIKAGFAIEGGMPSGVATVSGKPESIPSGERTEQLKSYLRRLGAGEDLESVRADFAQAFREVEASEIMQAEQELMREGTPLTEVQKLCDLHSALFHGATREEKIANAEKAVEESLRRSASASTADYTDKHQRAAALAAIPGHPLHTLTRENEALTQRIAAAREALAQGTELTAELEKVREVIIHYEKKGDLLYPLLDVRYGISGPSDVMWTVDDEIRDELKALVTATERGEAWSTRVDAVLKRAEEMIYKERNILFPICAVNFTEAEWQGIYRDAKAYDDCLGVTGEAWEAAEESSSAVATAVEGEVVMPGGHMTVPQLAAMLNTIPAEISFIDTENINRYFNEGPKVFKRPGMAIDRDVFSCHPPKIEPMVRAIIDDFRTGKRDRVPVWVEKDGHIMLVNYMAVRDKDGNYLGTMEFDQDMQLAKEYFTKKEEDK